LNDSYGVIIKRYWMERY